MICPHCSVTVKFQWKYSNVLRYIEEHVGEFLFYDNCPNCKEAVVYIIVSKYEVNFSTVKLVTDKDGFYQFKSEKRIYPNTSQFEHFEYIKKEYYEDYEEALKVLNISPKSSAALSRRLLQHILREEFKIKKRTLSQEIETFIELPGIPSHLTDAVDAIRNIGNFSAHPTKNKETGRIVNVEPGEAEWLIEIIEALFDFAFIQPMKLEERRNQLNEKLTNIGKPELKRKSTEEE